MREDIANLTSPVGPGSCDDRLRVPALAYRVSRHSASHGTGCACVLAAGHVFWDAVGLLSRRFFVTGTFGR